MWALKKLGYGVAIINNNPETVSTDFDVADRLYFEPLCEEDVRRVIELEKPAGVVVAFGGQTAIKLTKYIDSLGVPVLGTSADGIDMAEDRDRFEKLLSDCGIKRPAGITALDKESAVKGAANLGYPVLVRPSYVIGGQNMRIAFSDADVSAFMDVKRGFHRRVSAVQPHGRDEGRDRPLYHGTRPAAGHEGADQHPVSHLHSDRREQDFQVPNHICNRHLYSQTELYLPT